jgi:hypothetical protein
MRQNEFGNTFYVPANMDLTTATTISVTLTRPHVVIEWTLVNGDITIGTVDLVVDEVTYVAGTYVYRVLEEGDITQSGKYKVTLSALIEGKNCIGDTGCFRVTKEVDACSC